MSVIRKIVIVLGVAVVLAFAFVLLAVESGEGATAVVRNDSTQAVRSVTFHNGSSTAGGGPIAVGAASEFRFRPSSDKVVMRVVFADESELVERSMGDIRGERVIATIRDERIVSRSYLGTSASGIAGGVVFMAMYGAAAAAGVALIAVAIMAVVRRITPAPEADRDAA